MCVPQTTPLINRLQCCINCRLNSFKTFLRYDCNNLSQMNLLSSLSFTFSYRRNILIIEAKPFSGPEVLDVRVIVSAARATAVNHNREEFVLVRTFSFLSIAPILLVIVIVRRAIRRRGSVAHIDALVVVVILIHGVIAHRHTVVARRTLVVQCSTVRRRTVITFNANATVLIGARRILTCCRGDEGIQIQDIRKRNPGKNLNDNVIAL